MTAQEQRAIVRRAAEGGAFDELRVRLTMAEAVGEWRAQTTVIREILAAVEELLGARAENRIHAVGAAICARPRLKLLNRIKSSIDWGAEPAPLREQVYLERRR